MQSVLWTLYIVGVTVIVASPLPFPQLRSNHERPQGSKDDDGGMGPPTREILKDLSLISAGAIGTKFFYDTRPKIPPDDSGSDTARSRNGPPAENRPTKSGMIGFDLDKVPFHDGDEWGQKFRKTMTPGEIWKWEKCVERHGGKRHGTGMSVPDPDVVAHCDNEIRLERTLRRIRAERASWAKQRDDIPPQQEDENNFSILAPVRNAVNRVGNVFRKAAVQNLPVSSKGFNGGVSIPAAPIRFIP